jgi:protein-disulfide isomerase
MSARFGLVFGALLIGVVLCAGYGHTEGQGESGLPEQDAEVLRFVERQAAFYPGSVFQIVEDSTRMTPSGPYRWVVVERTCDSPYLAGKTTLVVDPQAERVWVGSAGELPPEVGAEDLRETLESFLPDALAASFGRSVRLVWSGTPRKRTGLLELKLAMSSGYGDFLRPAAVTADGRYLVLGAVYPWGEDPVAYRRQLLRGSSLVMWDRGAGTVDVVEFSDFQCPGCRSKWTLVKEMVDSFDGKLRHGMVNYPLTRIHPWAFRGASAAWCVVEQDPAQLVGLKELFYSLQREMSVAEVTPTALDYVDANGLDAKAFESCYLRDPSVNAVLQQRSLGASLGINATPTYVIDGWLVQVPQREWLEPMLERLIAGDSP